jgi:hypothetical protein
LDEQLLTPLLKLSLKVSPSIAGAFRAAKRPALASILTMSFICRAFAASLRATFKSPRPNSALREILRAAPLRSEHCPGGAQNPQGAISAAQPFEQYLDKRSGAVKW